MFSSITTRHQRRYTPRAPYARLAAVCAVVFLAAAPSALAQELVIGEVTIEPGIATAPPRQ